MPGVNHTREKGPSHRKTFPGGVPASYSGPTAARPGAGEVDPGSLYLDTDTNDISRSDGHDWDGGFGGGAGASALDDLTDVTIAAVATGDYLRKSAGDWVNVAVSQLLTDLKTVDGAGSGLDADLLDGLSSLAFVKADGTVALSGDLSMGSNKLINVTDPTAAQDAATKAYVDTALASLDSKAQCAYCSTAALPACTYSNGAAGVGATLTGDANGPLVIDSVTLVAGAVGLGILVTGQASAFQNGWYTLTQLGVVLVSPFILTRRTGDDQAAEIAPGYLTAVEAPSGLTGGTANNQKVFISIGPVPYVVGTDSLTFALVGGTYTAGTGLTLTGTQFKITDTAVTPGSYGSATKASTFTVDQQGRLTAAGETTITPAWGSITGTPTTLAGYGITDAQPLDAQLTSLAALAFAGNALKVVRVNAGETDFELATVAGGTNALLDGASHTDTVAQGVTRGSLIYGNATPKWDELVIGAANALLGSDGTDVAWFGCTAAGRAILDDANAAAQLTTLGLTANGQSLVTAANYAAMRALLDLEAGTDFYSIDAADAAFQPIDADLTAIAALTRTRGDVIVGGAANWTDLAIGTSGKIFQSDGTDPSWVAVSGDVTIAAGGAVTIGAAKVTEAMQVLADNTTQDVSTSKHGYAPKAPNDSTKFLNGVGAYAVPAGGTNALLDGANHTDTAAGTVARGDTVVGNSTPKWARLAKGAAGYMFQSDGTDVTWQPPGEWYYPAIADFAANTLTVGSAVTFAENVRLASASDASSYATGAITFGANKLGLITVMTRVTSGTANTPTLSQAGATPRTFTLFKTINQGVYTLSMFHCMGSAASTSGAVTADFASQTQLGCCISMDEASNVDLDGNADNGASCLNHQAAASNTTAGATSLTVTLAAFEGDGAAGYAAFGHATDENLASGGGYTAVGTQCDPNEVLALHREADGTNPAVNPSMSWPSSSASLGIAVEIRRDPKWAATTPSPGGIWTKTSANFPAAGLNLYAEALMANVGGASTDPVWVRAYNYTTALALHAMSQWGGPVTLADYVQATSPIANKGRTAGTAVPISGIANGDKIGVQVGMGGDGNMTVKQMALLVTL